MQRRHWTTRTSGRTLLNTFVIGRLLAVAPLLLLLGACATVDRTLGLVGLDGLFGGGEDVPSLSAEIRPADLHQHVRVLASDAFAGRAPGTVGEELTTQYLVNAFEDAGLAPGPQGSYLQGVPLVGLQSDADMGLQVQGKPLPLRMSRDAVLVSQRVMPRTVLRRLPLVFVGYGVHAPEYGWDDYAGVDVRGKIAVMLVNDPQVEASDGRLDSAYFKGRSMTYYGRWTYKYEQASRMGAAAALVIHNTAMAGYPWEVVAGSWGTENFTLDRADGNAQRVAAEGWLHEDFARELFARAGYDYELLRRQASRPGFRGFELPASASVMVRNTIRRVQSHNVLATVPGTDPALRDEWVIYSAHWDHLGVNPNLPDDQIYNGAEDNATGVAGLLEVAAAFAQQPARRSMMFLAVTAEEQGLLGARWYAENPVVPLAKTVANINMDRLNVLAPTRDIVIVGRGQSSLEQVLETAAATQGRVLVSESSPEKGYYFRSDHFEFAKRGVPALYADSGKTPRLGDPETLHNYNASYVRDRYHKVDDEYDPSWPMTGAAQDMQLLYLVGQAVANTTRPPHWLPSSEFATLRPPAP